MQNFFQEIDKIYILSIPKRKDFLMEQIAKNNIQSKVEIINAYTPDHPIVNEIIKKHYVYEILVDNPASVACTLGVRDIMIDIVKNKYKYAMVLEDDVVFPEEYFNIANKWITKENINKHFNIDQPYVLYLQSYHPQRKYIKKKGFNGILYRHIMYGEPAYITNDIACQKLLKHLYPITSPFDEYKNVIKKYFNIKQGILIPYICRELSANQYNFDLSRVNFKFERSLRTKYISTLQLVKTAEFNYTTTSYMDDLTLFLLNKINSNLKYSTTNSANSEDIMKYSIGEYKLELCNEYIISGTFDYGTQYINNNVYIISVRGKLSQLILKERFGLNVEEVYDIFIFYSHFNPKKLNPIYEYCFIYDYAIQCNNKNYIFSDYTKDLADEIVDKIICSKCVVSDNCRFITIANSYGIKGIYAHLDKPISKTNEIIAADHYSNINLDTKIKPIKIDINDTYVNSILETNKELFPQLDTSFYESIFSTIYKSLPFVLCKKLSRKNDLTQIVL